MKPNKRAVMNPTKRNIKGKKLPASPFFDEYLSLNGYERKSMTEAGIERFALDMVNWARDDEEALILMEFPLSMGICRSVFYKWRDKSPVLTRAIEDAKLFIAHRREKGTYTKKYDLKAIAVRQYQYDSEYGDGEIRQLKMKNDLLEQQVNSLVKYIDMRRPDVISEEEFKVEVEGTKE